MIVLGLAICLAGFAAALLPAVPLGTKYWAILLTISVLYPLVLARTFKTNRADYEFRILHWFPAGIFILWFILQLIGPRVEIIRILALGFFFLWSLPLVALGIAFIIIFAVHVLRRSRLRVTVLSLVLALFAAGALFAEGTGVNSRLQAALFPKEVPSFASIKTAFDNLRASLSLRSGSSGVLVAIGGSSSSEVPNTIPGSPVKVPSSSSLSSSARTSRSSSSVTAQVSSFSSSSSFQMPSSFSSSTSKPVTPLPPIIGEKNPGQLANSGPESAAMIGATLLAGYFGLLHARARKRV